MGATTTSQHQCVESLDFPPARRYPTSMLARLLPLAVGTCMLVSCSTTQPTPAPVTIVVTSDDQHTRGGAVAPSGDTEPGSGSTDASGPAPGSSDPGSTASPPNLVVLCHEFPPIKSKDPCSVEGDCAPDSPCHARACVAASKAPVRPANTVCTMSLVCPSIDVGRCDCVDGVCALVSR